MTEPASASSSFPPGTVVDGHRLEQVLREAPSGTLYAAVDAAGAPVLLRVLDPAASTRPAQRERIACDLLALQALEHPRLARVLAVGEHEGRTFYVLEERGRRTLADAVRRGAPLEEPELIWLARELAAGLAALHEVGLVHGGLGAQSIALGADGPAIVDVDWCARGALTESGDGPSVEDDVAALGRVLAFAATGAPGEGELADRAPWLSKRFAGLVDALGAPARRRAGATKAARLFAQIAREMGLADAPPARLIELAAAPQVEAAPIGGPGGELPLGRFGRYLLLSEVARGGMGVVYRARHADFERVFALKVMRADALASDSARRRFLREAEAAAALEHPAIVRVHDCGEVDGRAYIAMDFTEGCPLSEVYRAPDATLEQLLRLVQQVVRAVHYAHSRGIVHRDLKPENLLVDLQGAAHILDFGVAKRLGGSSDTMAGELVGTPAYMAPEQAEARHNDIDTRSDVYSLGATLFEVVTRGRLPFEGRTVTDTLTRILLEDPQPPSALRPDVPWEVDAIVLKALEKRRERRYQSAAELADDLERFLEGAPIRARQASRGYRARKWIARRWQRVAVAALMCAGLVFTAAAGEVKRRAEVASLVARGEAALDRRDAPGAQACFLQALSLSPDDMAAAVGHERAARLLEGLVKEQRDLQQRAQAARLLAEGDARLAAGDLDAARMSFEQAVAFGGGERPLAAQEGLARVAHLLAEREAASRLESQRARDAALALQHEADGQRHLERGDFRAAQQASIKAIAFGSARGEDLLHRAEEGLLAERLRQVQDEVDKRDAAEAARLANEARAALDQGGLDLARTLFLQVLAFDGTNERALEGLVEVDRHARARQAREEREERMGRAGDLLARAREAHARGRLHYREGEDSSVVRASYFDALERYDRTLTVAPDHTDARQERTLVAREAAVILRDEGQYELAELVLRFAGTGVTEVVGPADLPTDPHLVVVEADRINVRRAFGGVVRFQATRAFDRLRERVRARGDRFRVVIQVRSEPTATLPPTIVCRALWVRIEDKVANTVSPMIKVDLLGGPYTRLVTVDSRGRIVAPFDRAMHLDAASCVAQVETAVMEHLTKHTEKRR
jgi:serine/threonine protein kinase